MRKAPPCPHPSPSAAGRDAVPTASPAAALGCTHFKLRAFARRVSMHYDAALAQVGLKTTQYSLLSFVLYQGPLRSAELAALMALSTSTLSRNLRPLVQAGWIEITPGADARSHLVGITAAGRAKRALAQRQWLSAQQALNKRLSPDKVVALHQLIDSLLPLLDPAAVQQANEAYA